MSNTKEPEKNLKKLLQEACGPKRVKWEGYDLIDKKDIV